MRKCSDNEILEEAGLYNNTLESDYWGDLDEEEGLEAEDKEGSPYRRQRRQRGRKKRDSQMYYRRNRSKILKQQKKHRKKPKFRQWKKRHKRRTRNKNTTRKMMAQAVADKFLEADFLYEIRPPDYDELEIPTGTPYSPSGGPSVWKRDLANRNRMPADKTPAVTVDHGVNTTRVVPRGQYVTASVDRVAYRYLTSSQYRIHHSSYTSAVQEALGLAKKRGFDLDEDEIFDEITTGVGRPSAGKTSSHKLLLYKNGKPTRKMLVFQVYGNDGNANSPYELTAYIS